MNIRFTKILLLWLYCLQTLIWCRQEAITIVPVADLLGKSAGLTTSRKIVQFYQQLPVCGSNGSADPRIHQLIFNERVWIEEVAGVEARITIPNVFYKTNNGEICNSYWSLKRNFMMVDDLKAKKIDTTLLPYSIDFMLKKTVSDQSIITLKKPYHCVPLNMLFSAGTRFVLSDKQLNNNTVQTYALNPTTGKIETINIPPEYCIKIPEANNAKQKLFIQLLKEWSEQKSGFIPYVWGGCSFAQLCQNEFLQKKRFGFIYYERPDIAKPYAGFDCAGLIWRCAQICGIPLYCKNSYTFEQELKPLQIKDKLQEGDIIWFPGHVMVIADLKEHLIVEARAYSHGFGKIHALPISAVFKNIKSMQDLLVGYRSEKKLERLNNMGTVVQTIPTFKLLKFASVWR